MSESENKVERMGLDYLFKGARPPAPSTEPLVPPDPGYMEYSRYASALEAFAANRLLNAIFEIVKDRKPGEKEGVRLRSVIETTQMTPEILVPLCRKLVRSGLLVRIEEDPFGNDAVELTPDGLKIVRTPVRIPELMERMNQGSPA